MDWKCRAWGAQLCSQWVFIIFPEATPGHFPTKSASPLQFTWHAQPCVWVISKKVLWALSRASTKAPFCVSLAVLCPGDRKPQLPETGKVCQATAKEERALRVKRFRLVSQILNTCPCAEHFFSAPSRSLSGKLEQQLPYSLLPSSLLWAPGLMGKELGLAGDGYSTIQHYQVPTWAAGLAGPCSKCRAQIPASPS